MTKKFQKTSNGINLNFLPPAERVAVFWKIKAHALLLVVFFFVIWSAVVFVFMLQGLVFLRIQSDALVQRLDVEKSIDTTQKTQAFEAASQKTNTLLSSIGALAQQPQDDDASLVALISSSVPAGVQLHSLVINSVSGTITLGGSADTRDNFLVFQQRLQNQKATFAGVQSPLSNLLSPANISFSLIITLKR